MHFGPIQLRSRFPELGGFVLLDPSRLDAFCDGRATGADLLTRFTQTEEGDRACREGVAVPMLGIEPGYYGVVLRDAGSPGVAPDARVASPGWVVGTDTGRLLLVGLGYLVRWDPDDPAHAHLDVPAGWYRVDVLGHELHVGTPSEQWVIELVLHPSQGVPTFEADMSRSLDFPGSG